MSKATDQFSSIWHCPKCSNVYKSPVRLTSVPVHRCPSLKSLTVRPFVLKEGEAPVEKDKKAKKA